MYYTNANELKTVHGTVFSGIKYVLHLSQGKWDNVHKGFGFLGVLPKN